MEERRLKGEHVDDEEREIESAAYAEYRGVASGQSQRGGGDMANYDPYADNSEEMEQGLQLPAIYETVVPDGQDDMIDNPLLTQGKRKGAASTAGEEGEGSGAMVVPSNLSSSTSPCTTTTTATTAKLTLQEQLVLDVRGR